MKTLVIIPTYNERENISLVIEEIKKYLPNTDILIIDDNSPDRTYEVVMEISENDNSIKLIRREKKLGLGSAYVMGFKYAMENDYDIIFQMDADLSHQPSDLIRLLEKIQEGYDLVIGSRYISGVNVVNWPMKRLLLSYFANLYARIITGVPIKDLTSGFKAIRVSALKNIDLENIKSNGYGFQIEITFRIYNKGYKIVEIPIIFYERRSGNSKMSKKIIFEAAILVWRLSFEKLFKHFKILLCY
ncbi:MAG: polyprenol monophosphomannose synthase [candidate division WOR-3 bacterium]|nr:polyprenol monophosphomannose synthase [candidate division WOR-3 bacterium]MCX7948127.1 polyprenol monophosphomannose synthase [candidate division WOR-3 bacterium]MDW8150795.1 polyprenol monophosphomannose synthase [candidate division WOR-3 bacterium]